MLEFINVSISYNTDLYLSLDKGAAVHDLNMSLEAGKVLGLAGESGCGKSTIAKALLGILPAYASIKGEILYKGRNILTMPRRERDLLRGREISMIFQDPNAALNPIRKIHRQFYDILQTSEKGFKKGSEKGSENGSENSSEKGKSALNRRIEKELSAVHLPEPGMIMEKYPPQLSSGMKQRVVIAAAICKRPQLLIADEPTSALDASVRPRIIDEIARIKRENNLTILYISHDLAELERICDYIMVMQSGKVIEYGSAEQIINRPEEEYTKTLIEAAFGGY